ncbi:hypothetical protein [Aporhodopirellula aestuarii]|uniref:Uncharacterized protein n=1 Tax=Aporhodopirellula aestuarii TaxID=2950107 RepID=A0ABT0UDX4_9BACT|nr:hypothetical protein [Aporhodopirellula aestuarii]MCM2374665.1 hypothetical protein [Aporhodopirellula aestuarii]
MSLSNLSEETLQKGESWGMRATEPDIDAECLELTDALLKLHECECLFPLDGSESYDEDAFLDLMIGGGVLHFSMWSDVVLEAAERAGRTAKNINRGILSYSDAKAIHAEALGRLAKAAGMVSQSHADGPIAEYFSQLASRVTDYLCWFTGGCSTRSYSASPYLESQEILNARQWLGSFMQLDSCDSSRRAITVIHESVETLRLAGAIVVDRDDVVDDAMGTLAHVLKVRIVGRLDRVWNQRLVESVARWVANEITTGDLCIQAKISLSSCTYISPGQWEKAFAALSDAWVVTQGRGLGDAYCSELANDFQRDIQQQLTRIAITCFSQVQ